MKNLRTVLVLCLLTLGVVAANAQINWGVKAGLNVSSLEGKNSDYADYKAGFNAGVFGQYMITDAFGLESGLFYSMKGYKTDIVPLADGSSKTYNASYLQLPIQAIYKFEVGQNLYLYPAAGIYLAYGLGGTDKYFDSAKEFDLGLDVGVNLQFEKIIIGVGYERGFLKAFEIGKTYNSNVMVNVGYLF